MKTLHLLRHAKTSRKDSDRDDHDRPLSKRGRQTAEAMATHLRRARIEPDLVICSTARRARQTLDLIVEAIKSPKVVLEKGIYAAAQEDMWKHLRKLPESAGCVLLIGHIPGLHDLALALADARSARLAPPRGEKFPTCALASFRFEGAWTALRPHGAVLSSFTTPKAAKKAARATTVERTASPIAKARKKIRKVTAAPMPAKQPAKAKEVTAKVAAGTPAAKEMTKPKTTAAKTSAPRKATTDVPKPVPQPATVAGKAPPKDATAAFRVVRSGPAERSAAPAQPPAASPVPAPVIPPAAIAAGNAGQRPSQEPRRSPVIPPSTEIKKESPGSLPASGAPSLTPVTRIGTPMPPKRE